MFKLKDCVTALCDAALEILRDHQPFDCLEYSCLLSEDTEDPQVLHTPMRDVSPDPTDPSSETAIRTLGSSNVFNPCCSATQKRCYASKLDCEFVIDRKLDCYDGN